MAEEIVNLHTSGGGSPSSKGERTISIKEDQVRGRQHRERKADSKEGIHIEISLVKSSPGIAIPE